MRFRNLSWVASISKHLDEEDMVLRSRLMQQMINGRPTANQMLAPRSPNFDQDDSATGVYRCRRYVRTGRGVPNSVYGLDGRPS